MDVEIANIRLSSSAFGLWVLDFGLRTLIFVLWTLGFGRWTVDFGLWIWGSGFWFFRVRLVLAWDLGLRTLDFEV